MITYQEEFLSGLWDEVMPLLETHWEEIAHYKDIPLDPDIDVYTAVENLGNSRCYTVRDDGRLVGYVLFFVRGHMHYKMSIQAIQDVLFLLPEYRKGRIGIKFLQWAEEALTAEGVQVIYQHVKTTNKAGELMERLGYELVDKVYAKRLDKETK